ncbi:TetR/AcrR family transcriptional regulator [Nocardia rhizosphaerihabitans]|uniref:HTH tetR-type domain-containing protein n=1 Tax=Nocardia rhizosphaerihabitans TaxID=1691570 RepID=A0ABQ2KET8_9NOCA|nr:TetR/AcrR family transcriptional regulator [Nocardia rhizosphaerihabitans]GGN80414.1 hypothetical protein GCM10011610_29730 [Nocardia rhizosphaerihabitans]
MGAELKIDEILDVALEVFCRYGFRKTAMKDIAEAAGVSRAALYLHFDGKEALFRAGSQRAHALVLEHVDAALDADGPVIDRIDAAMNAFLQGLMAQISASPHGKELFESDLALSGEVTRAAREHLVQRISAALDDAAATGEIDLSSIGASSTEIATLALTTVEGIKAVHGGGQSLAAGSSLFLRILGAAVKPS